MVYRRDIFLITVIVVFSLLLIVAAILNFYLWQYQMFMPFYVPYLFFLAIVFYGVGLYSNNEQLRSLRNIKWLGLFVLVALFHYISPGIIITTPFHAHDADLYRVGKWLGYDHVAVFNYLVDHPLANLCLDVIYNSLDLMMLIVPLLLIINGQERNVCRFCAYLMMTFLIGSVIYYCYPSIGVAAVLPELNFPSLDKQLVYQFNFIHEYRHFTGFVVPVISMPSFHTIWAMLFAFVAKSYSRIKYWGLLYGLLVIASALLVGGHFVLDIVVGIVIAYIVWYIVEKNNAINASPKKAGL